MLPLRSCSSTCTNAGERLRDLESTAKDSLSMTNRDLPSASSCKFVSSGVSVYFYSIANKADYDSISMMETVMQCALCIRLFVCFRRESYMKNCKATDWVEIGRAAFEIWVIMSPKVGISLSYARVKLLSLASYFRYFSAGEASFC